MSNPKYTIAPDGKSIQCHTCSFVSHHPIDIKERFCSRCKVFHEDPRPHFQDVEWMRDAGAAVKAVIPQGFGFILLCTEYGDSGRLRYVSTIEREHALAALKEFIEKQQDPSTWMSHQ